MFAVVEFVADGLLCWDGVLCADPSERLVGDTAQRLV